VNSTLEPVEAVFVGTDEENRSARSRKPPWIEGKRTRTRANPRFYWVRALTHFATSRIANVYAPFRERDSRLDNSQNRKQQHGCPIGVIVLVQAAQQLGWLVIRGAYRSS